MGKAPAFQLYVGDYIQDTRMLSPSARGIWMDCLCFMWRAEERGVVAGSMPQLSRMFAATTDEVVAAIEELKCTKVADVTECNGIVTLTNRRMVREEKERESTRYRVKRFRNATMKRERNANITPPSSSSSSKPSTSKPKKTTSSTLSSSPQASDDAVKLSDVLIARIKSNFPQGRLSKPADEERARRSWPPVMDRLIRDGRSPPEICAVIEWCQADEFWLTNILSAKKLREKYDTLNAQRKRKGGGNGNGSSQRRGIDEYLEESRPESLCGRDGEADGDVPDQYPEGDHEGFA